MSSCSWITGCLFSIGASVVGAASNLCIRQSYLLQQRQSNNTKTKQLDVSKDSTRHQLLLTSSSSRADPSPSSSLSSSCVQPPPHCRNFCNIQPLLLRTTGILGISVLNPIFNIAALHYASPSILSPLGGLTLVFMVLLSEPTIGESSSPIQLFGAALIIAGEFVLTLFGDHTNDLVLTMSDIQKQYTENAFVAYFVGLTIWMMLVALWARCGNPTWQRFAWGIAAGSMSGSSPFLKDSMAVLAGMTASSSNGEVASANVPDALLTIGFYVLMLLAAMFPLSSLILSLECMKRYDATYSAACLLASQTVAATLMSTAHYHTWDHLSSPSFYPFGLFVLLVGCIVLATEGGGGTQKGPHNRNDDIIARRNRETKLLSEQKTEYGTAFSP
eukprot:scaffold12619_cov133-Skeletonema_menzelii.AAC.2